MTEADQLAEAVKALKDAHDAADLDVDEWNARMDRAWIAVSEALAAYNTYKRVTVEEVARGLSDVMYHPESWGAINASARIELVRMARAAMQLMGYMKEEADAPKG